MNRMARTLSFLALGIGIAYGIFILFGPTYTICSSGSIGRNQTPGPTICRSESLVVAQRDSLFPAPLLWIVMWSLAPVLAVRSEERRVGKECRDQVRDCHWRKNT